MIDLKVIEKVYIENLEENIISYLSERLQVNYRQAADIYYRSALAGQVSDNRYGIANLDYKYLANDLIENELKA